MKTIKIRLLVTPVYTLKGKRFIYSLADMAYGEWLVFKDDCPKFYINIFENKGDIQIENNSNFEDNLERNLKNIDQYLSLKQNIFGFKAAKPHFELFELEKLSIAKWI